MFPGSSVVEQPAVNRLVAGSNPARGATISSHLADYKRPFATAGHWIFTATDAARGIKSWPGHRDRCAMTAQAFQSTARCSDVVGGVCVGFNVKPPFDLHHQSRLLGA